MLNATIRNSETTVENANEPINEPINVLTPQESDIYKIIKANPRLSMSAMAQLLSVSDSTVKRTIHSLKQKHYIKHSGSNKTGTWIVLK